MKKIYSKLMLLTMALSAMVLGSCSDDDVATDKYPAPTVTDFTPKAGLPTSVVTITGTNFGSEREERVGRVYFGGVEAKEYVSYSDNQIQVRVPDGAASGPIDVWVWKNHYTTDDEFTYIPGAEVKSIEPAEAYPGSEITLVGINFGTFMNLPLEEVLVEFQTADGTTKVAATSLTETELKVTVPNNARSGALTVYFGDQQTVIAPDLTLVGDYVFTLLDFVETGGTISIDDGGIGSTRNGGWVIYQFSTPTPGLFDVIMQSSTTKNGSSVNIDINTDLNTLKTQAVNDALTKTMPNTGSWNDDVPVTYGPFELQANRTYYMKVTFLQEGTTWVGNVHELKIKRSDDQTATPVNGGGTQAKDYVLYESDFNSGSYSPFRDGWAWSPNHIRIEDKSLEFYYNHEALAKDNRRERRGAEVTCDYATNSEGWYGFKVYLSEGKFPMDEGGIIIAQIFNGGCRNSWAGHLSIDKGTLKLSYRHALVDPTVGTVGKLETNKWYPIVLHFKAGRNNKGRLQAWLGDNMTEASPAYDSGACSFGFGHWLDDEHLDNTGKNTECGSKDQLGCKFGLYVSNEKDITIRFDDLKALEGNPANAFNIVKP